MTRKVMSRNRPAIKFNRLLRVDPLVMHGFSFNSRANFATGGVLAAAVWRASQLLACLILLPAGASGASPDYPARVERVLAQPHSSTATTTWRGRFAAASEAISKPSI